MKSAVLFDLYGTLIDIKTDEYDPWVYSMLTRYLSYHSVNIGTEELKGVYFELIRQQLEQSSETYPEVDVYRVFHNIMHKYGDKKYSSNTVLDTVLLFRSLTIRQFGIFPGLYEVLVSVCKKYKTAIISDAQWSFSEREIVKLGLERFFKLRILSSRSGFKKPDTRLFNMAMEKLGVKPEKCVYIGDNPSKDLVGARNAGVKSVLFRSECRSYNGFKPDMCFNDYAELLKILKDLI